MMNLVRARRARAISEVAADRVAAQKRAPSWLGFEREPPQKWLERIEELRRLWQTAQAEEMLAEFKRRFPDHPLPLALR